MLFTICLFAYTAIKCFALVSLKRKFVSRIDWIQLGESNTKFFHSFAKRRRNQNAIKLLIKEDGSRCCTQQQIKDEVVSFYQNLMGHAADRIPMVDKKKFFDEGVSFILSNNRSLCFLLLLLK